MINAKVLTNVLLVSVIAFIFIYLTGPQSIFAAHEGNTPPPPPPSAPAPAAPSALSLIHI